MAIRGYYKQVKPADLEKLFPNADYDQFNKVWDESDLPDLDVDKAWEALHQILTGSDYRSDSPLSKAVFGSIPPDKQDDYFDNEAGGYYGSNYLTASEVAEIAQALSPFSEADLRQKFSNLNLEAVGWGEPEDYVLPYGVAMLKFYADAARRGSAVLVDID